MTLGAAASPWPTELRLKRETRELAVSFDDGVKFVLPAEYLRVESPSAEVQGHGPGQRQVVSGRARVGILQLEPVGNYAVRLLFDDQHDSGIYTWAYLRQLGAEYDVRWPRYLKELTDMGLSREPTAR